MISLTFIIKKIDREIYVEKKAFMEVTDVITHKRNKIPTWITPRTVREFSYIMPAKQ